jgi:hypothetical protein
MNFDSIYGTKLEMYSPNPFRKHVKSNTTTISIPKKCVSKINHMDKKTLHSTVVSCEDIKNLVQIKSL